MIGYAFEAGGAEGVMFCCLVGETPCVAPAPFFIRRAAALLGAYGCGKQTPMSTPKDYVKLKRGPCEILN